MPNTSRATPLLGTSRPLIHLSCLCARAIRSFFRQTSALPTRCAQGARRICICRAAVPPASVVRASSADARLGCARCRYPHLHAPPRHRSGQTGSLEAGSRRRDCGVAFWERVVGVDLARASDRRLFRVLEWTG
jgi:hypothetical protein